MIYRFICPCCGEKTEIRMPVAEYHADGHPCKHCGSELIRDPSDFGRTYQVNCDGFYTQYPSN